MKGTCKYVYEAVWCLMYGKDQKLICLDVWKESSRLGFRGMGEGTRADPRAAAESLRRASGRGAVLGEVVGPVEDAVGLPGWPRDRTPGDTEKMVS